MEEGRQKKAKGAGRKVGVEFKWRDDRGRGAQRIRCDFTHRFRSKEFVKRDDVT